MTTITVEMLRAKGACAGQVAKFQAEWPSGCPVCIENINRCIEIGIYWVWAEELLTALAWAEYQRVTAPAWAEYQRVKAPALVAALLSMDEAGVKP